MHHANTLPAPALILLSGLPGAGKTTFAHALLAHFPAAEHIESDALRRSLAANPTYAPAESARVFAIAGGRASAALAAGRSVIIDATNLTNHDRKRFLRAARETGARLVAVRVLAPDDVVRKRLSAPRQGHSQAGIAVFEQMRMRPRAFTVPAVLVDTRFDLRPSLMLVLRLATVEPGGGDAR
jgi:predicted kinase